MSEPDRPTSWALARYQVISAYLALEPPRGERQAFLEQLAARTWVSPDGEAFQVRPETIRVWIRRYRRDGLKGLEDKPRPRRGVGALTPEQVELVCALKREVPERSLERIIQIAEGTGRIAPGVLRRSTLHRVLKAHDLSRRPPRGGDRRDLDRFEAEAPNDLWQSDMLVGPWLPDPRRPDRQRRAYLYAFLDDHSRLCLHGRFSFKGDLPALELVFRRAVQKYGVPRRVYYDNGQVYRAKHMRHIVGELGVHRLIHTRPYRPEGHGKIEAFNRLVRSAFLAELRASRIRTLDALNEAFLAWIDLDYQARTHGQTGQPPLVRWRAGLDRVRYAGEDQLRDAFLWSEHRTPDKTGILSLWSISYQVSAKLARRRVEVRYDPEALEEVEIWHQGRFVERVRPYRVQPHRRPPAPEPPPPEAAEPTVDWLAHLSQARQEQGFQEPHPRDLARRAADRRDRADQDVVDLLADHLDTAVFDEETVRRFLDRHGPFELERARGALEPLVAERTDHHVLVYLDAIRDTKGSP